jgi:hypothetical protein
MSDAKARRGSDGEQQRERPEPACKTRFRPDTCWVGKEWGPGLATFLRPCKRERCFGGDGPDEPADGQTVVRSSRYPTTVHRVGQTVDADGYGKNNNQRERGGTGPLPALARDHDWPEPQPLASVGDLRVGDAVAWGTRKTPLAVVAMEWPLEPEATVRGPQGGTYTLEERAPRDFWSHGRINHVVHFPAVPAADTDTPPSE